MLRLPFLEAAKMARVLRDGAFTGETQIVTGAAQGIGFAIATAALRIGLSPNWVGSTGASALR